MKTPCPHEYALKLMAKDESEEYEIPEHEWNRIKSKLVKLTLFRSEAISELDDLSFLTSSEIPRIDVIHLLEKCFDKYANKLLSDFEGGNFKKQHFEDPNYLLKMYSQK